MNISNNDIDCSNPGWVKVARQSVCALLLALTTAQVSAQVQPSGYFVSAPYRIEAGQTLDVHFYFDMNYYPLPVFVGGYMSGMGPGDSSSEFFYPGQNISTTGDYVFAQFTPSADSTGETITLYLDYCGQTTITVVPKAPPTGALQVNINPVVVVNSGGQWQVDGGGWQSSGTTVSNLSVGTHTVSFSTVAGWPAPPNQIVTINANQVTKASATYLQQFGSVCIMLSPEEAVGAGVQWKLDGGPWQNSGALIQDLLVGSHSLEFSTVFGWAAPVLQTVNIEANKTTTLTGLYTGPHAATATAVLANGFVVAAEVVDPGCGYTNPPVVSIVGGGGSGAQARAVISNGVVTAISILNPGSGYTTAPAVIMPPPYQPNLSMAAANHVHFKGLTPSNNYQLQILQDGIWNNVDSQFTANENQFSFFVEQGTYQLLPLPLPTTASATAQLAYGFVVAVAITSGGSGYPSAPTVILSGGGGSGAQATASISNGVVTAINVVNPGSGYTSTPAIEITPPPVPIMTPTTTAALRIDFTGVTPKVNFQLQSSPDLTTWSNVGAPFTTSNGRSSQYVDPEIGCRFFRLTSVQ